MNSKFRRDRWRQGFSASLSLSLLACLFMLVFAGKADAESRPISKDLYGQWGQALSKHVDSSGLVDYKGWKADRRGLDLFLAELSGVTKTQYGQMSRQEKLALWINAYNAFTIKQILDNYPIHKRGLNFYPDNSIRQIDGVWDKHKLQAAGRKVTLSEIENKILRGEFKEPLIHFAINCASRSCPVLLKEPYTGADLSKQLELAARMFVRDGRRNKIDSGRKKVNLSKIFDWFGGDFVAGYGPAKSMAGRSASQASVINFLIKYTTGAERDLLNSNDLQLSYLPYDWSLNDKGGR